MRVLYDATDMPKRTRKPPKPRKKPWAPKPKKLLVPMWILRRLRVDDRTHREIAPSRDAPEPSEKAFPSAIDLKKRLAAAEWKAQTNGTECRVDVSGLGTLILSTVRDFVRPGDKDYRKALPPCQAPSSGWAAYSSKRMAIEVWFQPLLSRFEREARLSRRLVLVTRHEGGVYGTAAAAQAAARVLAVDRLMGLQIGFGSGTVLLDEVHGLAQRHPRLLVALCALILKATENGVACCDRTHGRHTQHFAMWCWSDVDVWRRDLQTLARAFVGPSGFDIHYEARSVHSTHDRAVLHLSAASEKELARLTKCLLVTLVAQRIGDATFHADCTVSGIPSGRGAVRAWTRMPDTVTWSRART